MTAMLVELVTVFTMASASHCSLKQVEPVKHNRGDAYANPPELNFLLQNDGVRHADICLDVHRWLAVDEHSYLCELHLRAYSDKELVIRVKAGDKLNITFSNMLEPDESEHHVENVPGNYNTTNLHTHGLHISSVAPADDVFIEVAGRESISYLYEIGDESMQAPGTHWIHAHHHGSTMLQVMHGALAMLIVEDDPNNTPKWILDMPEVLLTIRIIHKNRLKQKEDKLAELSHVHGCGPVFLTVNSQLEPKITLYDEEWTRFRIVNGGPNMHLAIVVPEECEVWILALDGIYMSKPVHMPYGGKPVFMASGNRRDLAVKCHLDGHHRSSREIKLESTPKYGRGSENNPRPEDCGLSTFFGRGAVDTFSGPIATLVVTRRGRGQGGDGKSVGPDTEDWIEQKYLRPPYLSSLVDEEVNGAYATTVFALNGANHVNGRPFSAPADSIAEWTYPVNKISENSLLGVGDGHPFHQHIVPFQVRSYPQGANYTAIYGFDFVGEWMDVLLAQHTCFNIIRQRPDIEGKQVVHCHLLLHEDTGMMRFGEVVADAGGTCTVETDETDETDETKAITECDEDKDELCPDWAKTQLCKNEYFKKKCPTSCGDCPAITECDEDKDELCPEWAKNQLCKNEYFKKKCPTSCGDCPEKVSETKQPTKQPTMKPTMKPTKQPIDQASGEWVKLLGWMNKPYEQEDGLKLEECKMKCRDGTWAGCKAFSRLKVTNDDSEGPCFWAKSVDQLDMTDQDSEWLYIPIGIM